MKSFKDFILKFLSKIVGLFKEEPWKTKEGVEIMITDAGKISINAQELSKTQGFENNLKCVEKLRASYERK